MMFSRIPMFRASFVLGLLLAPVLTQRAAIAEPWCVLESEALRVAFDRSNGHLVEFTDKESGHAFADPAESDLLWTLRLHPSFEVIQIDPGRAGSFSCTPCQEREHTLELVWQDFGMAEAPDLTVRATVSLAAENSTTFWNIAVENAQDLPLVSLFFPRIPGIAAQEDERLAAPLWMGQLTENPRNYLSNAEQPRRWDWAYPGQLSLQCVALYREDGPGIFLSADDADDFLKRFCVFGGPDGRLGIEMIHLPEGGSDHTERYEPAYQAILGTFEGDWFTAAERYREWALEQPWAREARLQKSAVADWAADTAIWVWNRGRSENVLVPAMALQERSGLSVSVFWHWWHGCAYDIGFPEYFPPREGAEPFLEAVREARIAGVNAMVYMNQRLWGMTTESWEQENAERYAVKGPDGEVRPEYYNTFERAPCAPMCIGTSFWRNKYAGLAEKAVNELGVSAIYMDQACLSLACYDPAHGHPIGGGTYWVNGFRMLEDDIRERCNTDMRMNQHPASHDVVLAGEGCGESWLPHLDLMLSLQVSMERYAAPGIWEPIPFFQAVYHGYTIQFGNYSSLTMPPYDELWPAEFAPEKALELLDRKFAQQFRIEQARAFVWGQQPTIANFRPSHFEDRPEETAYMIELARLRLEALKYLLHGTMLRPPAIGAPEEEIDVSRLSIYAGQHDAVREYRRAFPTVLASAWQAPDGDVCVVLANVSETPQPVVLELPREVYPIPAGATLSRIDTDGTHDMGPIEDEARLELTLFPTEARIYEFAAP